MRFYRRPLFWFIVAFVFSMVLARYVKTSVFDTGYARAWYYGDAASCKNVVSASKYYLEHGFAKNSGLPVYEYNDTDSNNDYIYSHYPPLAEWTGGVIAKLTGRADERTLSLFPLLLSCLLFYLIYKNLQDIIPDDRVSFLGASLLVLSNYFIGWAHDIHQHVYVEVLKWWFVFAWWRYLRRPVNPAYLLPLLCLAYFCMGLLSYEPYVYIAIVIVGLSWVETKKIMTWPNVILLAMPVLAFSTRLYINYCYFGSLQAMLNDMYNSVLLRTGGEGNHASELGRAMRWDDYVFLLPKTRLHRLGHFYLFPSLVIVGLGLLGMWQLKKTNDHLFRIACVFYLAAFSWILVMPQHALIHIFTLRHMAIFLGLVLGYGMYAYAGLVRQHLQQKAIPFLVLHSVVLAYSAAYILVNTIYMLYLKFGYLYPMLGKESYELIDHFSF